MDLVRGDFCLESMKGTMTEARSGKMVRGNGG